MLLAQGDAETRVFSGHLSSLPLLLRTAKFMKVHLSVHDSNGCNVHGSFTRAVHTSVSTYVSIVGGTAARWNQTVASGAPGASVVLDNHVAIPAEAYCRMRIGQPVVCWKNYSVGRFGPFVRKFIAHLSFLVFFNQTTVSQVLWGNLISGGCVCA